MKKILSFLLLFLCISSSFVFAVDVTATGTGATEEEAKQNARIQLSEMIFGTNVFSVTTTKTTATTISSSQDASVTSASFQSTSNFITSGKLIGVEYKVKSSNKKYTATATIPDSAYAIYEENIKESAVNVKALYRKNTLLTDKTNTNYFTMKKSLLLNLYNALIEYQSYRQILIYMQHSSSVVDIDLDISVQSITFDYESLLIEEENEIRAQIGVTGAVSALDYVDLQYQLNQNIKAQTELKNQQEEIYKQVEAQRIAEINSQMKSVIESTSSVSIINLSGSFWETYQELKNSIASYNSLINQYNQFLNTELSKIEQTYTTNRNAIQRKAYSSAQMQDGQPTAIALEFRKQELNELLQAKNKDKDTVTKLVSENFSKPIQSAYDTIAKLLINLQESTFIVSVSNGDYTFMRGNYEGNNYRWPFSLVFRDGFSQLNLTNLYIDYKDLSGKSPYLGKDRMQYEAYSALVTSIESRELLNFTDYYDVKVTFKLTLNIKDAKMLIDIQSVQFTNKDGKLIKDIKDYKTQSNGWTSISGITIPKNIPSFVNQNSHIHDQYNAYLNELKEQEEARKREEEAKKLAEELRKKAEEQAKKLEEEMEKERIKQEQLAQEKARLEKLEKLKKKRLIMRNESFLGISASATYGLGLGENLAENTISASLNIDLPLFDTLYVGISPSFLYSAMKFNTEGTDSGNFYRFALLLDAGIMDKSMSIGCRYGLGINKEHYFEIYSRIYLGFIFNNMNLLLGVANDIGLKSLRAYVGGQYVF